MIYELLKARGARGIHRAMPTKEIMAETGMTRREVARAVQRERRRHFICSKTTDGGGYYRPVNIEEIRQYVAGQEQRIAHHAVTLRLARRFMRKQK